MADVIRKATNRFTKGLVMDFSPENTKNELLTHALNATLLTFNGNELSLQNDMGNARVETAYLPEGYMPVGTCEYGGIIYIVSYNPLENKSQIGCFPSPERNLSSDELGLTDKYLKRSEFQEFVNGKPTGKIKHTSQHVILRNDNLNPGDKFLVCADSSIYGEKLKDLLVQDSDNNFIQVDNPIMALNVVSIEDSGKITYLNSDILNYDVQNSYIDDSGNHTDTYKYHILGKMIEGQSQLAVEDIDNYRNVLSSGYSVFKSKTSGKLAILAELITIDSYSVTHSIQPKRDASKNIIEGSFDIIIHTEVSPEVTQANYSTVPKLQYYYLQNSQGYVQVATPDKPDTSDYIKHSDNSWVKPLFVDVEKNGVITSTYSSGFLSTPLGEIYTATTNEDLKLHKTLEQTGSFGFPKKGTYHGKMVNYEGDLNGTALSSVYTKFTEGKYHRLKKSQITGYEDFFTKTLGAKFYRYDSSQQSYSEMKEGEISNEYTYFVKTTDFKYTDVKRNADKYKDQGYTLYVMTSEPYIADDPIVKNESIEKFQVAEVHTYKEATLEDIASGKTLYVKDGNQYTSIVGSPESGKTYYIYETKPVYISIGFEDVDRTEYSGDIYYYPSSKSYREATEDELNTYWNFTAYPYENESPWGSPIILFEREEVEAYKQATAEEMLSFKELGITLYYKTDYVPVTLSGFNDSNGQLFITVPVDAYVSNEKFEPNETINYIEGKTKPSGDYPKDDPIHLYSLTNFIPSHTENNSLQYGDLKLASIKIPDVVSVNGLDLPFKYDYTLVPCMSYGRLDHLAVSNTVDFSKLHAFNQSNFNVWKYYIDDNQLRLTFGAEIFDTYETDKVDGLVLEFYDLWGFAGSLEITDKKAYSGVFTKIIPLNALGSLSKNRVEGNRYINTFKRNINITESLENPEEFTFNGKPVSFRGYSQGWNVDDSDNDCGTLYSNLVYGVKTYLRKTTESGYDFIPKKEFFLYTLPIYNEYYYTVNDFSKLEYPSLDFNLTFKLRDSGSKVPYTGGKISNGYSSDDSELISQYTSGFYRNNTLNTVKYYKYSGKSDLFLEIGLKKEYENLNLSYDSQINSLFSCDLQLVSNDNSDKSLSILHNDSVSSVEEALNYTWSDDDSLNVEINKLTFDNGSNLRNVQGYEFQSINFITKPELLSIPINYEFIVGYKIDINNIMTTEVPATTVCALCHKNTDDEYNYGDFGIYEENDQFLSLSMFYNGGTSTKEVFGICRQINTSASATMTQQCSIISKVETDAQDSKLPRVLNSGDPLKQIVSSIGKLTFCQPHAHGMSENTGVNMYDFDNNGVLGISPSVGGKDVVGDPDGRDELNNDEAKDNSWGVIGKDYLEKNPLYNLSLNTVNAIEHYGEFISTIDYGTVSDRIIVNNTNKDNDDNKQWGWTYNNHTMLKYTGFTSSQVETFNRKLINTMKSIYAYNPDYDSLSVNVGEVSVRDYNTQFISNIISNNASITFNENTLNDYIYIGSICFSKYLDNLNKYSLDNVNKKIRVYEGDSNVPIKSVNFVPNLEGCGSDNPILISSLTYNIPVPEELHSELEFKASNQLIVKHEDGQIEFMEGTPNKKSLYGFDSESHKLVELDVSNYTINSEGKLSLNSSTIVNTKTGRMNVESNTFKSVDGIHWKSNKFYTPTFDDGSSVKVYLELTTYATPCATSNNSIYFIGGSDVSLYINMRTDSDPLYSYNLNLTGSSIQCVGKKLNPLKLNYIDLTSQSASTLDTLVSDSNHVVVFSYTGGHSESPKNASAYWKTTDTNSHRTEVNVHYPDYGAYDVKFTYPDSDSTVYLYKVTFNSLDYKLDQKVSYTKVAENVIKSKKTTNYSSFNKSGKYVIDTKFNNARIRGTSLTINDLVYTGSLDGHRLFVRGNCFKNGFPERNIIYYRDLDRSDWGTANEHKNHLYLQAGPCFTSDNR